MWCYQVRVQSAYCYVRFGLPGVFYDALVLPSISFHSFVWFRRLGFHFQRVCHLKCFFLSFFVFRNNSTVSRIGPWCVRVVGHVRHICSFICWIWSLQCVLLHIILNAYPVWVKLFLLQSLHVSWSAYIPPIWYGPFWQYYFLGLHKWPFTVLMVL
jgi:hypothetical protein